MDDKRGTVYEGVSQLTVHKVGEYKIGFWLYPRSPKAMLWLIGTGSVLLFTTVVTVKAA